MRLREVLVMATVLSSAQVWGQTGASAPAMPDAANVAVAASAVAEPAASEPASDPASSPAAIAAAAPAISASAVRDAVKAVKADPLLPGTQRVKYLRFKTSKDKDKDNKDKPASDTRWWIELLANLSTGMRVLMWLLGAALLIWVVLRVRDWVQVRNGGPVVAAVAPTHVGSLDIRPESLPADVGAAARGLWQRGDTRAALSLLYRGALSRLVHGHGVPIRAASTESECLALSATRLAPPSQSFLAQLVTGWQLVAYARRDMSAEDFEQLCADFDTRLPAGATP